MKNKGYILIALGICLFSFQLISKRIEITQEQSKIEYTIKKEVNYAKNTNHDVYDMILEIPKIYLKKGVYSKNDSRNYINQNVTIHQESDYPDRINSNVILMAHSGNSEKSFFNHLCELDSNSLVKIIYKHKIYTYKIDHFYSVLKSGQVEIIRDNSKKTITLITCNPKDKTKQLVYIGYLIDEI